ncbi:MAG: PAS domain-containing protein [Desulfarculaceae bacterium]|nr:PAS domain-containing protein [Desulfarculaceae bacterium]MCF8073826.1 PAS domain-containing protein [Desulfarculaceae bacterium]MCF8102806.1 PAS domain-containing protein [Desulfarculaceae bacterium]MCF8116250.1 PAS domain-containing protein [Desulfarculaceae bacterium]
MNQERENVLNGDFDRAVYDAVPAPIMVVDRDVVIIDHNQAAGELLASRGGGEGQRAGEALHCLHAGETDQGCGRSPVCPQCVVRGSVESCFVRGKVSRRKARLELQGPTGPAPAYLLVTTAPLEYRGRELALLILEDIGELVELRSLLPICARCKKVRDQSEMWHNLDRYLSKVMDVDFTHSLCPDCAAELYPRYVDPPDKKLS